jgi:hypothetical protein
VGVLLTSFTVDVRRRKVCFLPAVVGAFIAF